MVKAINFLMRVFNLEDDYTRTCMVLMLLMSFFNGFMLATVLWGYECLR